MINFNKIDDEIFEEIKAVLECKVTFETIVKEHEEYFEKYKTIKVCNLLQEAIKNLEMEITVSNKVKQKLFVLLQEGYFNGVESYSKIQLSQRKSFVAVDNSKFKDWSQKNHWILSNDIKVGISNFSEVKKIELYYYKKDEKEI